MKDAEGAFGDELRAEVVKEGHEELLMGIPSVRVCVSDLLPPRIRLCEVYYLPLLKYQK